MQRQLKLCQEKEELFVSKLVAELRAQGDFLFHYCSSASCAECVVVQLPLYVLVGKEQALLLFLNLFKVQELARVEWQHPAKLSVWLPLRVDAVSQDLGRQEAYGAPPRARHLNYIHIQHNKCKGKVWVWEGACMCIYLVLIYRQ